MPALTWYARRLEAMEPSEMLGRVHQTARQIRWRGQFKRFRVPRPAHTAWDRLSDPVPLSPHLTEHGELEALHREADAYLEHRWFYFDLNGVAEPTINWHSDPLAEVEAPRTFAFDIEHRDETIVGDIKNIWEKNRHHHLTVLAAAYCIWRDERYADEVANQILDWIDQNPYLCGVNWSHPLEHGIRLISWVWCERWLRGSRHHERCFGPSSPFWHTVWLHQHFIASTFSHGSSANNHLIGEMAGLYVSSVVWPIFPESEHWITLSQRILEEQAVVQTFESGLNREMAFAYHLFSLEFFLLTLIEARRGERGFSASYITVLRKMAEAIPPLTDVGGNLPRYGDGDEGMAILAQAHSGRRDSWVFQVAAALTDARVPVPENGTLAASLLGVDVPTSVSPCCENNFAAFHDAGLFALASFRGQRNERFVLVDAGPHGFLSIAAHAHADALSFTLSVGGVPMLVDPGTYAYHTEPKWRTYFRSTAAHNTAGVDHDDQSRQAGAFLWTSKAKTIVTRTSATSDEIVLSARHDGYRHIGILHERTFRLAGDELSLTDAFSGQGSHHICLSFHFAPECHVSRLGSNLIEASRKDIQLTLELPADLEVELVRGTERGGWYSPGFRRRVESYSIRASREVLAPVRFTTRIRSHHEG